ncbi:MAG: hypothetical protein I3273_06655 [Candidatus Moeniiplasma glomeromycotorum]|nr:hypothetical protein [Candidatus Moeniiplasma glomeromycotorum]MCE8168232.1 hypothetical protein [Candidatus Moeniiplasma glomeromycotorum]MCE8169765.1 hypothetical protein [Candidatus Moeniiplasma glomeromycotorum]
MNCQAIEDLESQKFESGTSKCKDCQKNRENHILKLDCPEVELVSDKEKKCFRCQKIFTLKYVLAKDGYSCKNNWDYWTEKEEYKGKYICNACLLYLSKKDKKLFLREVQNSDKRKLFRVYVCTKIIA